jgi:hypothetical protein
MNLDLREGATDGALKKEHRDRGGLVELTSDPAKNMLHGNVNGYGVADGTSFEPNLNDAVVTRAGSAVRPPGYNA